jgi:hypothetical protein
MARNLWVLEERFGEALDGRELERLLKTAYELVVARLPKSRLPGAKSARTRAAAPRRARAKRRR